MSTENTFADMLVSAYRSRQLIEPLPRSILPIDEATAYRIADQVNERLGYEWGGWKIGATAVGLSEKLGAQRPIAGRVAKNDILYGSQAFNFKDLMTPVDECEFAFELARDVTDKGIPWTAESIADCVAALYPAIEVGERRLSRNQVVPILALIADNSAAGKLVLGDAIPDWKKVDLASAEVMLRVDGAESGRGKGKDVLGHPLNALAWLANERLFTRNEPLKAGDIVSTGSCTGQHLVHAGERHVADFGQFGTIELTFS